MSFHHKSRCSGDFLLLPCAVVHRRYVLISLPSFSLAPFVSRWYTWSVLGRSHFVFLLKLTITTVSNHVGHPKTNQSPPADSPSPPEAFHSLALLVGWQEVLGLDLASLADYGLGWDLPSAFFGNNVVHGAESAIVFANRYNGLQCWFTVIESLQVLRFGKHRELASSQYSLQGKLDQNSHRRGKKLGGGECHGRNFACDHKLSLERQWGGKSEDRVDERVKNGGDDNGGRAVVRWESSKACDSPSLPLEGVGED